MKLTKLRLSKDASNRLRFLAGRPGLTPNLLCRIGFCLSLAEPSLPNPDEYPEEEREFNRYTLLGEYDDFFVALLKERCQHDGLDLIRAPTISVPTSTVASYFSRRVCVVWAILRFCCPAQIFQSPLNQWMKHSGSTYER